MKFQRLVNTHYESLTPTDLYIYKYIKNNRNKCSDLSIDKLAKNCNVSKSSILRFTQKIGLTGYTELKLILRQKDTLGTNRNCLNSLYANLVTFLKNVRDYDLDEAVKLINEADNIYAYGTGDLQKNFIRELKRTFMCTGNLIFDVPYNGENNEYIDFINSDDLIIVVSYSGENPTMLQLLRKLFVKNVKILAITSNDDSTLAHLSTVHVNIESFEMAKTIAPDIGILSPYFIFSDILLAKYLDYNGVENEDR
ncbi:MAG: MurR/RpiR family transcriptional regulator [Thomasclavelia sp.]|nr:MurR/RpiR family transcriptional regulator [Thomasclavelia sp.]